MEIIIVVLLLLFLMLSVTIIVVIFDKMDNNSVYPSKRWTGADKGNVKLIKAMSKQDQQMSDIIERNRRQLRARDARNSSYDPVTDPKVHATVAIISDSRYDSSSSSNSSSGGD